MSVALVPEFDGKVLGLAHLATLVECDSKRVTPKRKRGAVRYWVLTSCGSHELCTALGITLAEFQEWCRDFANHRAEMLGAKAPEWPVIPVEFVEKNEARNNAEA